MKSSRLLACVLFALCPNVWALQWPISSQDDPGRYNYVNATFGEIHNSASAPADHFHTAIDIDVSAGAIPVRAAESGVLCDIAAHSVTIYHGITACEDSDSATKKTHYMHIVPNSSLPEESQVSAGVSVVGNVRDADGHLHFEMWYQEGGVWYRVNPLQNDISDWVLGSPTDNHDPEINNVILQPIAQPSGIVSGYEIKQTAGAITDFLENSVNVHFWDRPGSIGTIYGEGEEKLVVYGSIAPIVNARDTAINATEYNSIGDGLTIQKIVYRIDDGIDKYKINFDRNRNSDTNAVGQLFHTTFNSGNNRLNGNNDFIELRSLDDIYLYSQKKINNVQSNGVWATMAAQSTDELFEITPTAKAKVNSDAKYKDGIHSLAFEADDAAGNYDYDELNVVVDNFRPYLEQVEITKSGEGTKYSHVWNFDGNNLNKAGPTPNIVLGAGEYTINLQFSEEVVNPTLFIDGTNGLVQLPNPTPTENPNNFSATFSVGNNSQIQDGLRTLTVKATDLAGNSLLALDLPPMIHTA